MGCCSPGRSGQADPRLGVSYELYAITAAVVGGCSLSGGVGSIRGTVLGLFLIQIVIKGTAILVHFIDSTQIEGLVLGTVVVLAVGFNQRFRVRGRRCVHRLSPSADRPRAMADSSPDPSPCELMPATFTGRPTQPGLPGGIAPSGLLSVASR